MVSIHLLTTGFSLFAFSNLAPILWWPKYDVKRGRLSLWNQCRFQPIFTGFRQNW